MALRSGRFFSIILRFLPLAMACLLQGCLAGGPSRSGAINLALEPMIAGGGPSPLLVAAEIDGHKAMLVVDTGSYISIIDPDFFPGCDRIGETGKPEADFLCLGETPAQSQLVARDLRMGRARGTNVAFLLADFSYVRESTGQPVSGVLGMNALSLWSITFDPIASRLTLRSNLKTETNRLSPLPATDAGRPVVVAEVGGIEIEFLIDSGSQFSILSRSDATRMIGPPRSAHRQTYIRFGNERHVSTEQFLVTSMRVDDCTVGKVQLLAAASDDRESRSKLGVDVLRSCIFRLEQVNGMYSLDTNSHEAKQRQ